MLSLSKHLSRESIELLLRERCFDKLSMTFLLPQVWVTLLTRVRLAKAAILTPICNACKTLAIKHTAQAIRQYC